MASQEGPWLASWQGTHATPTGRSPDTAGTPASPITRRYDARKRTQRPGGNERSRTFSRPRRDRRQAGQDKCRRNKRPAFKSACKCHAEAW